MDYQLGPAPVVFARIFGVHLTSNDALGGVRDFGSETEFSKNVEQ